MNTKTLPLLCTLLSLAACAELDTESFDELEVELNDAEEPASPAATDELGIEASETTQDTDELALRTEQYLAGIYASGIESDLRDTHLVNEPVPLYRPDMDEPAYYEFPLAPEGFVVVSTGRHDYPIAHWSTAGQTLTAQLAEQAERDGQAVAKFYKLDVLSYVAEDANGELVADLGGVPQRIDLDPADAARGGEVIEQRWEPEVDEHNNVIGGEFITRELDAVVANSDEVDLLSIGGEVIGLERFDGEQFQVEQAFEPTIKATPFESWEQLKADYAETFAYHILDLRDDAAPVWETSTDIATSIVHTPGDDFGIAQPAQAMPPLANEWYADGALNTFRYKQMSAWEAYNPTPCKSGCGATAWALLFGWADQEAHSTNKWSNHRGIYRYMGTYGSSSTVAPLELDNGIRNITNQIRGYIKTFCFDGQGATYPGDMGGSIYYLIGRDHSPVLTTFNSFGFTTGAIMTAARDVIKHQHMPVIIGTGWLEHYPVAYGFGRDIYNGKWFRVNNGWGGISSSQQWIPAAAWFHGQLVYVP